MAAAWLLTFFAIAGIVTGVFTGHARSLSSPLAAAGGGLLSGIALFWLVPEIATKSGWLFALLLALAACAAMFVFDRLLVHSHHASMHSVVAPLLIAAAVHSFLDGWSVRAFFGKPLGAVVPAGLAMHKIPEGLALGWISQKSISPGKAVAASAAAELMTVAGAFAEPRVNASGLVWFGQWWESMVLAVIAGSFLFLGLHVLWPDWKRPRTAVAFLAAFATTGFIRA